MSKTELAAIWLRRSLMARAGAERLKFVKIGTNNARRRLNSCGHKP